METELKLPYAEVYRIKIPRKEKCTESFVYKELLKLHPGFSEESLWDYKPLCSRKSSEKEIIAVVLERDFYIEKRALENNISFYVKNEAKKIRLFSKFKFIRNGERRKIRIIPFVAAVAAFLSLIILSLLGVKNFKKPIVIEETVIEVQTEKALNVLELINHCAKIIETHKGIIKQLSFNAFSANAGSLVFSVTDCEPYSLIKDLNQIENILECSCGSIVYNNEKENFEIKANIKFAGLIQKTTEEMELFELQNELIQMLKEINVIPILSNVEKGSRKISFKLEVKESELKIVNEKLDALFYERNLFITDFLEAKGSSSNLYIINFEVIELDKNQGIKNISEEEKLSEIFEKDKTAKKVENIIQKQTEHKENIDIKNYKKIGSIQKDGKQFFYYRNDEGKIILSEDNYE